MGYRTYIEDVQIFGNNECYELWIDFLKSQGIEVDKDDCYDGYITDVMGALETIEKIVLQLEEKRQEELKLYEKTFDKSEYSDLWPKSIFDFTDKYALLKEQATAKCDHKHDKSLTDMMIGIRKNGYIFMSCEFLEACKDKIVQDTSWSVPGHFNCYKLKENCKIHVRAC